MGVKHGPAAHSASMKMRLLFRQTLFEGGDFHSRGEGEGVCSFILALFNFRKLRFSETHTTKHHTNAMVHNDNLCSCG